MEKLRKIIINPQMNIKQALKRMDEAGEKTLFVVNSREQLMGSVTDGDIRRWILKGASLEKNISVLMNRSPIFLEEGFSKDEARDLMLSKVIECIPIIDAKRKIVNAIWWIDLFENKFKKRKITDAAVVIMSGGEGTRLLPLTNILPKSLMPIGEKPIIEHIIDNFVEYGCKDFYLSINYKANILKAYFSDIRRTYNVHFIQEEKPLGTAGSLYLLKGMLKNSFFVTNCDILIEADYSDIIEFHKNNNNKITIVVSMKHYTIPYGICDIANGGILKAIKEKPEYDLFANTGMYLMEPEVLEDIPQNTPHNATDLINNYISMNKKIGVYPISEKSWLDTGQWQELQNTLKRFGVNY